MSNQEIAEMFELLAKLMEIHGENSFKAKSYSSAAFRIEKMEREIDTMTDAEIRSIPGIGDSISKKILEIGETGALPSLVELLHRTPPGVVELLSIKGIGPKKIGMLWFELGIQSVDDLEQACRDNKLPALKGFTTKTQEEILHKISFRKSNEDQFLWAKAEGHACLIRDELKTAFPDAALSFTGAFRRKVPTIDRISLLTTLSKDVLQAFFLQRENTTAIMETDRLLVRQDSMPMLEFYFATPANFYQQLFLTTGSDAFIQSFLERNEIIPADTEAGIFENTGMTIIDPDLRDASWVMDAARKNDLPALIQPEDVKGLIHCHSKWSDGKFTIEEMAQAAIARGLEYMVISDHSQSAFYAKGLTPERVLAQRREIDTLNHQLAPFKIFHSIEVDILPNGNLDYTDEVLASLDMVITSVHSILHMTEEKAMQRLLSAVKHPATTILGHPTGRLLLMREGYPVNHEQLIKECVANNVVIEVNANPRRLDLDWTWVHYALDQGAMLSVNPDAHAISGIDDIRFGVLAARKGGLTSARNLSSMSLPAFEKYIASIRKV